MSARRMTMLLAALIGASGCYTYQPVRPVDAISGSRVRATVTAERAAELEPVLRGVSPRVSGRLVERSDQDILLEVPLFGATPSAGSRRIHNRVTIPFSDVVSLEARQFSTWRTVATVGLIAAAVGGAWAVVSGEETADDKPKEDTDNAIITIFSLPFGIGR